VNSDSTIHSIAIGTFDGVHLAHQRLISLCEGVVVIERGLATLTRGYRRSFYIDKPLFIYHFDRLSLQTPQEFIAMLKEDFPKLKRIVVGYDFTFGHNKSGNAQTLKKIFEGEVVLIKEMKCEGVSIHSSAIKSFICEGQIDRANKLLGRPYEMMGCAIKGQGIGTKALVSTINIVAMDYHNPKEGVYATRTLVNGVWYDSISFIGHRVSSDHAFAIETHIIDKTIALKNPRITLQWLKFIRPNQAFEDLTKLKLQILKDIEIAKKIHRER